MVSMRLHLGCGFNYLEGYVNVDNRSECPDAKIDKNVDLDKYPWPFKSRSSEEVFMNHVIEHLKEPDRALREVGRILKPDGIFRLNVPHYSRSYGVHVHEKGFSIWSVLTDTKDFFEPVSIRLVWDYPENFKRGASIFKPFCRFWNGVLNLNHWFAERFLIYKFGGIQEIRFVLRKKQGL